LRCATVHAQWVVIDPTNLVQNTLTAIRTLEQINNQIKQLQNEAQMLTNQARNLASLPFNVVSRLRANLATTQRLIARPKAWPTTWRAWIRISSGCIPSSTPPR
jgi:P-type conjugative transfer protein TrbJ